MFVDDSSNDVPNAFSLPARLCVSYTPVQKLHQQSTLIVHWDLDLAESQAGSKKMASHTDLWMEGNHALREQSDEIGLALRCGGLGHKSAWDGTPE